MKRYLFSGVLYLLASFTEAAPYQYIGTVEVIQTGHKNSIVIQSDTYAIITLDPLPVFDGTSCALDSSKRIILDAGTEWGKIMYTQLLTAQATGRSVMIGTKSCATQTSTGNKWEVIDWMKNVN